MASRLKERYRKEIVDKLKKELNCKNIMQVPKLEKIVVNVGMGKAIQNIKLLDAAVKEMEMFTGQKAVITRAKKSIAGFKLREGMPIGCKVTLRGNRMYEFLDRLISLALPRIRDFQGLPAKSFDGRGNYAMGMKEQIIFPEIHYDTVDATHGMDIVICTTASNDKEGMTLLKELGIPFAN